MSDQSTVKIRLSDEAQALVSAYQGYTGTSPEEYIATLVDKTLPTLKALVESFEEAGSEDGAVMELFGRKMAETMLQQQQQAQGQAAIAGNA